MANNRINPTLTQPTLGSNAAYNTQQQNMQKKQQMADQQQNQQQEQTYQQNQQNQMMKEQQKLIQQQNAQKAAQQGAGAGYGQTTPPLAGFTLPPGFGGANNFNPQPIKQFPPGQSYTPIPGQGQGKPWPWTPGIHFPPGGSNFGPPRNDLQPIPEPNLGKLFPPRNYNNPIEVPNPSNPWPWTPSPHLPAPTQPVQPPPSKGPVAPPADFYNQGIGAPWYFPQETGFVGSTQTPAQQALANLQQRYTNTGNQIQ